jgi:hypothetical protein
MAEASTVHEVPPDGDAAALIALSGQALVIARHEVPDAVLRQIFTGSEGVTFVFTDAAATLEIAVNAPSLESSSSAMSVGVNEVSPLLGRPHPGIDLTALSVGPGRVELAITSTWPGCNLRLLTLYGQGEDLEWTAFCDTPEGVVSGTLDNRTGVFLPSAAPPARMAVTATARP